MLSYAVVALLGVKTADVAALEDLARRRLGSRADQVSFALEPKDTEEWFRLGNENGKVRIEGTTKAALARGLYEYLRGAAGAQFSWDAGDRITIPSKLRLPDTKSVRATVPYRFAYNFCTLSYTAAWWDWSKWEREIDYLALSGVTHALVLTGMESAYFDAFEAEGYSKDEIRKWLTFPSHQPWQWMSNLEGFNRPVPQAVLDRRAALGRKIADRMRELGIVPVFPGYYGIVPSDYSKRHPGVRVFPQGTWVSPSLKRPDMLSPTAPDFLRIARRYYAGLQRVGGITDAFAADPFHEGGSAQGVDLPEAGSAIYRGMESGHSRPLWVLQSWGGNPRIPMLAKVDRERVLILDLACESSENWRSRNAFDGYPWAWSTISNFGGNSGISGRLDWTAHAPYAARADAKRGALRGVAATPEAISNNPALWEMLWDFAWRENGPSDVREWLHQFAFRRYGVASPEVDQAMDMLRGSCYGDQAGAAQMPLNSVVAALPDLDDYPRARTWGETKPNYDVEKVRRAWLLLLKAPAQAQKSDGYRFDVVDLGLMALGFEATRKNEAILSAYRRGDRDLLREKGAELVELIEAMDDLARTHRTYLVGTWLTDARRWGSTTQEKEDCEWAARTLLTTWFDGKSDLADYSNRHWAGLLRDVYVPRWRVWLRKLDQSLIDGKPVDVAQARNEAMDACLEWNARRNTYPSQAKGSSVVVSKQILDRIPELRRP